MEPFLITKSVIWWSSLMQGFSNQGYLYCFFLAIIKSLHLLMIPASHEHQFKLLSVLRYSKICCYLFGIYVYKQHKANTRKGHMHGCLYCLEWNMDWNDGMEQSQLHLVSFSHHINVGA